MPSAGAKFLASPRGSPHRFARSNVTTEFVTEIQSDSERLIDFGKVTSALDPGLVGEVLGITAHSTPCLSGPALIGETGFDVLDDFFDAEEKFPPCRQEGVLVRAAHVGKDFDIL